MTYHERLEQTLLLISEARERAEAAARAAVAEGAPMHVTAALRHADDELLVLHRRLLDDAVLSAGEPADSQLALDAA
jgi:hypothetical protein